MIGEVAPFVTRFLHAFRPESTAESDGAFLGIVFHVDAVGGEP
jgi:hypothetical protein